LNGRRRGKERCSIPVPNAILALIREWIIKAENDLKTAAHTLTLGVDCPTDTVSFHAQQCVEIEMTASQNEAREECERRHQELRQCTDSKPGFGWKTRSL
jgi:hypothetical protein